MAQSNARTTVDLQLIPMAEIKKEEEVEVDVPLEFVSCEPQECVLCVSQTSGSLNIFRVNTNTSGTPIHAFISKITNTELPYSSILMKYICKTCFDLVNDLDRTESDKNETEHAKLKKSFQMIICKNPFFYLPQGRVKTESEGDCDSDCLKLNEDVKKENISCDQKEADVNKSNFNNGKCEDKAMDLSQVCGNGCMKLGQEIIKTVKKSVKNMLTDLATLAKDGASGQETEKPVKKKQNRTLKSYECPICHRIFHHKPNLQSHFRTHTGEKPFQCSYCQRWFGHKPHLQRHLRTHTGEKPYSCNVCQRCFVNSHHLQNHLKTHNDETPYICDVCQRPFKHLASMKRHTRTHTGEKPFECHICQRRFSINHHLQGHLRTHTGDKPYKCNVCDLEFKYLGSVKRHLLTHKEYCGDEQINTAKDAPIEVIEKTGDTFTKENALGHIKTVTAASMEMKRSQF